MAHARTHARKWMSANPRKKNTIGPEFGIGYAMGLNGTKAPTKAEEQCKELMKKTQDVLKSVFVEHEMQEEEVGVMDNDFPMLSVDKPGWWWVMHTCNDIYKLESVGKDVAMKKQSETDVESHKADPRVSRQ